MSLEAQRMLRVPERWFEVFSAVLGLVVAGLVGWIGLTLVGMRDDILFLKAQIPEVDRRLDRVEVRVDAIEARGLREAPQ
jgi:uncharacterized membrane protein YccC